VKVQISRFSPHQNAKVLAVLMAFSSLPFVIPMFIAFSFMPPGVDARGNPVEPPSVFFALLFPVMYLVMGYIMVIIGCWLYNLLTKYIGGIEYEVRDG
jgi:hypothetical protein